MNSFISILITVLLFQNCLSKYNIIISNYQLCAKIGRNIIKYDNGNGFDAAIGVMLCEGVAKPQDMGIGGGFFGIIEQSKKDPFIINSRERCPKNINTDAFKHSDSNKIFGKTIGVPSAMRGYQYLHDKYGKTTWYNIVKRIKDMCINGFPVVIGEVLNKKQYQYLEESHRNIFINKETEQPYIDGETWKRPDLANTMDKLMKFGPGYFNTTTVRNEILKEINEYGGNITNLDFNISPEILRPRIEYFTFGIRKYKIATTPLPGGGPSLIFILRIMEAYFKLYPQHYLHERYYVLIEAMKFAFSFRTEFGDPNFSKMGPILNKMKSAVLIKSILSKILKNEATHNDSTYYLQRNGLHVDHGTANIVVKTPKELLVLTSTINLRFGSWVVSKYGFIYNNQMSDFSIPSRMDAGHLPPSPNNFPQFGKYPISSISTSIVYQYNTTTHRYERFVALGAAGGPKIITAISQVLINMFFDHEDIITSISKPRFHHQLEPRTLEVEKDFYQEFRDRLIYNYHYEITYPFMRGDYSAVTGIQLKGGLKGTFDPRRPGSVEIF